jgi:D-alanyl-D-alanine carboxypeptidase (penicillin-binding protein 5/6)
MRPAPRCLIATLAAVAAAAIGPAGAAGAALASISPGTVASTSAKTTPAGVTAAAAELLNATTGRVMWTRNMNTERPMASITKVMTALVVIKAGELGRKIRVTAAAEDYGRSYEPSEAGFHPGDVLTTRQVLEGLLLPSGSDAAYLLATTYGPGWPAFVRKMNAQARRLGMTRTHYANFDGLPWPTEHTTYTTAHDLILLAEAAMKLPSFRQIAAQHSHVIGATRQHHRYYWANTNLLLRQYPDVLGIKTGFTEGAGYCLLFAARRYGAELLGVVLDSTRTDPQTRFTAAARMLNWGFDVARPQLSGIGQSG